MPISDSQSCPSLAVLTTSLQQFLADLMGSCLPCSGHQIVCHSQVESVSSGKIGVSGERHHIIFTQPLPKPIGDNRLTDIVECSLVHAGCGQYLVEVFCEIVDDAVSGTGESPFAAGPQYLLDMIVAIRWN